MSNRRGGRLGPAFRGVSESDDAGDASLEEAFDAAATAAVLNAISEDHEISEELRASAAEALSALESGDPGANDLAKEISAAAVGIVGAERYVFTFDAQIEIETRPHNQWVRTFAVTATPQGG